jgi:hypothetical protein
VADRKKKERRALSPWDVLTALRKSTLLNTEIAGSESARSGSSMSNSDRKRPALTVAQVETINRTSQHQLEATSRFFQKAALVAGDGDRVRRDAARECVGCFYVRGPRIAGQAFTPWLCTICCVADQHPNTGVPRVCNGCAEAYGLCVTCGGDRDMKFRTKKFGRKARKVSNG